MNHHEIKESHAPIKQDENEIITNEKKLASLRNSPVDDMLKSVLIEMQEGINEIHLMLEKLKHPPVKEKEWLNSEEVKQLLGVSKRTLQKYRDENLIPFTRFNGIIRYKRKEIILLINKSKKLRINIL